MSATYKRSVPLADLKSPKVLPEIVRERIKNPPEVISLRTAVKHFSFSSPATIKRDCEFLGIPTSDGLGGPSLTRQRMFVLYAFLSWRKIFMELKRREYWRHVASEKAIQEGIELGPETASKELKLTFMGAGGGSIDDFNERWAEALFTMRSRSRVLTYAPQV